MSESNYRITIGSKRKIGGDVIDAQQYVLFFKTENGDFEAQVGCNTEFLHFLHSENIVKQTMLMQVERSITETMEEGKHLEPG